MPSSGSHLQRAGAAAGVNRNSGAGALFVQGTICRWAGMWQLMQRLQRRVLTLQLQQGFTASLHHGRAGEARQTIVPWQRWPAAVASARMLRAALCLTPWAAFVCTRGKDIVTVLVCATWLSAGNDGTTCQHSLAPLHRH